MKKMMLAVVAMTALVFASCRNGMVANDSLSSPDVVTTVTDNGVIVLSWENVMDASSYDVTVKMPGTEEYQKVAVVTGNAGRNIAVFDKADKLDTKYEFKVFANSTTKFNLTASVTEVSVTTPEEWKTLAIDAAALKLVKVPGTANQFYADFPVDAGYDYSLRTTTANVEAAVAFAKADNLTSSGTTIFDGAKYVKEVGQNADGDEIIINKTYTDVPVQFGTKDARYLVVKAEPKNKNVGKTVYAIASASVAADLSKGVNTPSISAVRTSATTARITATVGQVDHVDTPAENLVVYRQEKKLVQYGSQFVGEYGAWTKVGAMKKDVKVSTADTATYYYDDTIVAYEANKAGAVSEYNYFVANAGNEYNDYVCSTVDTINNTTTSTDAAYNLPDTASTIINNFSLTVSNKTTLTVDATIIKDAKLVKVSYGKFNTLEAAKKATAGELTSELKLESYGTETNPTYTYTTDGQIVYTSYGSKSMKNTMTLEPGKTIKNKENGKVENVNAGSYYVFRIEVEYNGKTYVETKGIYLTKTEYTSGDPSYYSTLINF